MKKQFAILALFGALIFGSFTLAQAQDGDTAQVASEQTEAVTSEQDEAPTMDVATDAATGEASFHQRVKEKFIEGGAPFMWPILICLILGLAVSIERIITLNLATTNTKKLLTRIEDALSKGGIEAAKDVTKNTKGPVASIFTQGLMRSSEGMEMVEKSIVSYGGVEMGRLEKGLIWISLFISLGPMLGFFGTVIGMVGAFDAIEAAGDISPQVVAGGMKVALLTTVGGLIVGMVLQVFYNYLVSKIDNLVNDMEDASITLVDMLVKHKIVK
ncbi:MAG: MotA/TolQ/ExbB proton channel family protein [Cyclobacteriaceae bacterium]|nr:MotA/TolQ/ExbB proton channel family protein [Cyclobacteriaceae bacterium]